MLHCVSSKKNFVALVWVELTIEETTFLQAGTQLKL